MADTGADSLDTPVSKTALTDRMGAIFWVSTAWIALMLALAACAPVLHLQSPNAQDYRALNIGPTLHHLLGTDDLGRDLLSRVIYGSRVSLVIGFASIALGLSIGAPLGMLAAYRKGALDAAVNGAAFAVMSFPPLLAILVIEAFWGASLLKLTLVFAAVAAPQLFRVVRATALAYTNREFVIAAEAMGAKPRRIIRRELLPNVLPAMASFALIGVALAIILEGSLAFLGLSVSLPTASLGNIVNLGVQSNNLRENPFIALWPALYIFVLLSALNLVADRLRSNFDVRLGAL